MQFFIFSAGRVYQKHEISKHFCWSKISVQDSNRFSGKKINEIDFDQFLRDLEILQNVSKHALKCESASITLLRLLAIDIVFVSHIY